jgi:hypothetical protein
MPTQHHHRHPDSGQPRKKIRKDGRMWAALVLMPAAGTIYVLSPGEALLSLVAETSLC